MKDYALAGYTTSSDKQTMLAFSSVSDFTIRLPSPNVNQTQLHLMVTIRDTLDCVVSVNLSMVVVSVDVSSINQLVGQLYKSTSALASNPLIRLLSSGNQNTVAQLITSISQYFNQIDDQNTADAISSRRQCLKMSCVATQFSFRWRVFREYLCFVVNKCHLSTSNFVDHEEMFHTLCLRQSSTAMNTSGLAEFTRQQNLYASVRDYLIAFTMNLTIATPNSIRLQASSLSHLTQSTHQLTRSSVVRLCSRSLVYPHLIDGYRRWPRANLSN